MKLAALSALGIIIGAAIASSTDPCYLVQRLTESGAAVGDERANRVSAVNLSRPPSTCVVWLALWLVVAASPSA